MTDDECTSGNGSVRITTVGSKEDEESNVQDTMVPQWCRSAPAYILNLNLK